MGASSGVPLDQLCCPTCGVLFQDFSLHTDSEEAFDPSQTVGYIQAHPAHWRRFLLCPNGHKWTVKTIWRAVNRPDHVQLDRYIGEV